jgi:two-component system chemotaxis response regulator CheY
MRLKILSRPTGTIDGVSLDYFHVGGVYELRSQIACVFIVEGWADLVTEGDDSTVLHPPPPEVANIEPLVLVVDDEPEVRRLTESLLTEHGYHVIVASHGKDAILRLREQVPDLIVLDLNMPVMDGWQFRTEQRYLPDKKCAAIPVLLLTAEEDAAVHAQTLQAVGVIAKPFDPDDLLDAVSAAIGSQASAPDGIRSMRPRRRNP